MTGLLRSFESKRNAATAQASLDFMVELFRNASPDKALGADIPVSLLLAQGANRIDTELRDELEQLAVARAFGGFTWLFGPPLYRRNRVIFRPFILNHFSSWHLLPIDGL